MALERRRQLVDDALPHPSDDFRTRLRHEGREQEARKRPGQAKAARREGRRRQVERAVDIDLLERVRAIAAVGRHPLDRRGFHRGQYLPASLPPPVASKPSVAPVSAIASISRSMKSSALLLTIYLAPMLLRMSTCASLRTMLTSGIPSFAQILTSIWPRFDEIGRAHV